MLRSADRRLSLNEAVSSEVFNQDWPEHLGSGRERIIHMGSPEFGIANLAIAQNQGVGTVAWPSTSEPVAVPFRVFKGMTVYQLGWQNGSGTMTDSVDIGIYDASWNRKVSGGGTARSGAAAVQWVDVTDTFLQVGKYYIVQANNGTTASQARTLYGSITTGLAAGLGVFDSATTAYPLPNPLTNMAAATIFTFVPISLIAARVPF
jgi:hypothetical protein